MVMTCERELYPTSLPVNRFLPSIQELDGRGLSSSLFTDAMVLELRQIVEQNTQSMHLHLWLGTMDPLFLAGLLWHAP